MVDADAPVGPGRKIPTAQGLRTLPPHQDTLSQLVPEATPADANSYFILRGSKGTAATVGTRQQPPDSVARGGLAYRIKMGRTWVGLTNHIVIEYGLARGLLKLQPFDYGGLMWTDYPTTTQLPVTCSHTAGESRIPRTGQTTTGTVDINKSQSKSNSPVPDGAHTIAVSGKSFSYSPKNITVGHGEPIAIQLTSRDTLHDWTIPALKARVTAQRNQTAVGGFVAPSKPGKYVFYCSIPGHRKAGMQGTLIVE